MIIGNGDIAIALPESDFIFFASGVSNSKETRESEFKREKDLLFDYYDLALNENKRIIYFSSLSIFYADTPYTRHKRRMEQYVKMFPNWTILRIGNIDWGDNPFTIINYFKAQKAHGELLEVQDTYRYIINREEFLYWIGLIPDFNCEMNIPGRRLTINQIVDEYT